MGLLASVEHKAPEPAATEYYCGCCGLVIAPNAPAAR